MMSTSSTTQKRYTASDLAHDVLLAAVGAAAVLSFLMFIGSV
jgi:hypothetical protein